MLPYLIAGVIGYGISKLFEDNKAPKYDGGGSVLLAPNGKPSNLTPEQYKLVRTPAFKKWFGDWENDPANASKVVDENGEPLVVWRGESKEFNKFDYKKLGSKLKTAWRKAGFYFSPTKKGAEQYMFFMQSGILKQFFLNIKNPYTYDSKEFFEVMDWGSLPTQRFKTNKSATDYANSRVEIIKNDNYDGFFVTILEDENVVEIVAFEPTQIKLANGTNTTFDSENPDIRFDGGGLVDFTFEKLPDDYKDFYQIRAYKNIGGERYYFSRLNTHAEKDVFTIETKEGKEIARATLNETENYLINIRVNENYRRKGLGLNLYNFIEYVTGKKLKPSPIKISQQAKGLWNKRNPDIRFDGGGNLK